MSNDITVAARAWVLAQDEMYDSANDFAADAFVAGAAWALRDIADEVPGEVTLAFLGFDTVGEWLRAIGGQIEVNR